MERWEKTHPTLIHFVVLSKKKHSNQIQVERMAILITSFSWCSIE